METIAFFEGLEVSYHWTDIDMLKDRCMLI